MSTPAYLRSSTDAAMAAKLAAHPDVKRAKEALARDAERVKIRRQLLATSVRLNAELAPDLHRIIDMCVERLGVQTKVEPYVYPSATVNAGVARPEDGRLFVMFSSEILDRFDDDELCFVVGHELAHHVFDHHDIPIAAVTSVEAGVDPQLALELFSWSRFAEISADRGGLYCTQSLEAVGRALFKLASGLRGTKTNLAIDALLAQMEEIEATGFAKADDAARADWFSTHPFSPLRLKAAQLFANSEHMKAGGTPADRLELETNELMGVMEPGYLKSDSDEARAMRRVLLAGGMLVAAAHGEIDVAEVAALERFLGEGSISDKLSVEALAEDLPRRLEALKAEAPRARRAQVVRDLCVIALADGHAAPDECKVIADIALALGVGPDLVDQTFGCEFALD